MKENFVNDCDAASTIIHLGMFSFETKTSTKAFTTNAIKAWPVKVSRSDTYLVLIFFVPEVVTLGTTRERIPSFKLAFTSSWST